jgi:hypothetical protein
MNRLLFGSLLSLCGASIALAGGCSSSSATNSAGDAGPTAPGDAGGDAADAADATSAPDPVAVAASCGAYATAYCALLTKCDSQELIGRFGANANCVPRVTLDCTTRFGLSGIAVTTGALDACTAALPPANCAAVLNDALPTACDYAPGKRANGDPCFDRAQCSSGHCEPAKLGASCGACAEPPALGAKCQTSFQNSGCGAGQICDDTCGKVVALGDACDASNHCGANFFCLNSKCVAGATLGNACNASDPTAAGCVWGEVCAPVCQPVTALEYNTPDCAVARAICGGHAVCDTSCVPPPVEGKPCGASTSFDEKCQWPAVCEGGQCVLGTATSCK